MIVLAKLLFLALVALEKINAETGKLVKKLDVVAVNVSQISSITQSATERLLEDAMSIDKQTKSGSNSDSGPFVQVTDQMRRVELNTMVRKSHPPFLCDCRNAAAHRSTCAVLL